MYTGKRIKADGSSVLLGLFSMCTGELQVNVKGVVRWRLWLREAWWGKKGSERMHCPLTITQSTLVPSLSCDCAGGQSPDSAHPFPGGELWKPKTAAIPSLSPHSSSAYSSLPLSLPPSVSISLSLSLASNVAAAMHQRELQNNARGQPGIWRALSFVLF